MVVNAKSVEKPVSMFGTVVNVAFAALKGNTNGKRFLSADVNVVAAVLNRSINRSRLTVVLTNAFFAE